MFEFSNFSNCQLLGFSAQHFRGNDLDLKSIAVGYMNRENKIEYPHEIAPNLRSSEQNNTIKYVEDNR